RSGRPGLVLARGRPRAAALRAGVHGVDNHGEFAVARRDFLAGVDADVSPRRDRPADAQRGVVDLGEVAVAHINHGLADTAIGRPGGIVIVPGELTGIELGVEAVHGDAGGCQPPPTEDAAAGIRATGNVLIPVGPASAAVANARGLRGQVVTGAGIVVDPARRVGVAADRAVKLADLPQGSALCIR